MGRAQGDRPFLDHLHLVGINDTFDTEIEMRN